MTYLHSWVGKASKSYEKRENLDSLGNRVLTYTKPSVTTAVVVSVTGRSSNYLITKEWNSHFSPATPVYAILVVIPLTSCISHEHVRI